MTEITTSVYDQFILTLSADEFQLLQDVFAGVEDPADNKHELDYILDQALDISEVA